MVMKTAAQSLTEQLAGRISTRLLAALQIRCNIPVLASLFLKTWAGPKQTSFAYPLSPPCTDVCFEKFSSSTRNQDQSSEKPNTSSSPR